LKMVLSNLEAIFEEMPYFSFKGHYRIKLIVACHCGISNRNADFTFPHGL